MRVNPRDEFLGLWRRIGATSGPVKEYNRLVIRYDLPQRYYHTFLGHVGSGLCLLAEARPATNHDDRALVAWFYHDAIQSHIKGAMDECHSGALCATVLRLARLDGAFIRDVVGIIKLTDHKGIPDSANAKAVLDTDLAIFGASPKVFDLYEAGIRAEYAHVPEEEFRHRRAVLLERFLNRNPLYWTDYFRDRFDVQARQNLLRSIRQLRSP